MMYSKIIFFINYSQYLITSSILFLHIGHIILKFFFITSEQEKHTALCPHLKNTVFLGFKQQITHN